MATNDLEHLVRSIVEGLSARNINLEMGSVTPEVPAAALSTPVAVSSLSQVIDRVTRTADVERGQEVRSGAPEFAADAGRLVAEVEQLRRAVTETAATQQSTKNVSGADEPDKGSSAASTVLKTIGMVTGIGPIATGLLSLFGGSSKPSEPPFPSLPFEPPPPIAIQAGLTADRQFTGVTYGADGTPRFPASNTGGGSSANRNATSNAPPIQINVQAMDSRSFLDRSDDIARAVREAMLHSHALNDVVSEL